MHKMQCIIKIMKTMFELLFHRLTSKTFNKLFTTVRKLSINSKIIEQSLCVQNFPLENYLLLKIKYILVVFANHYNYL